ncbi:MAG: hypothetical protein ACRCYX_08500 [Dermatophilaceae bacterium]
MPVLAYPGPRGPRSLRITVEVPDGWVARPATGTDSVLPSVPAAGAVDQGDG